MSQYQVLFNSQNSLCIDIWEPDGVDAGKTFTLIGNKSTGEGFYLLLKVPSGLPAGATVSSAVLRMPEMNYSGYRGDASLTAKFSRVIGAWDTSTKWSTCPAYDSAVYSTHVFNESAPSSSNYDYRTDIRYVYRIYDSGQETWVYKYLTSYQGSTYYDGYFTYAYYGTTYNTYIKYRNIDITQQIQDIIDHGGTGIIVWFDLPGPNDSRKYFKTPLNTNESLQFMLTVDYTTLPTPTAPTIGTIGTVTDSPHTFNFSASSDTSGIFSAAQLSYELLAGTTTYTSAQGTPSIAVNFKTLFGLQPLQYYYTTTASIAIRAKTPAYNGTVYYSAWTYSNEFAIDYRIAPSAPTISVDNATPYEGQAITFTCGCPTSYNTHTAAGATNTLTYYVKLANGTALANGSAAVTSASKTIAYTVGNITSGADLVTTALVYCVDANGLVGTNSTAISFTVKRYRKPVISIGEITRTETGAAIPFTVQDTGYGGTQASSQINKIQYDVGSGYVDATLGTWTGLSNSFSVTGLTAGTQYSLSVKAINNKPDGTTLTNLTGDPATDQIFAYLPAFCVFKDSNGSGSATKALIVHSTSYAGPVEEGSAVIEKDIYLGGNIYGRNLITIGLTANTTIGATSAITQIALNNTANSNGAALTLNSNGVKVGAGVTKVLVSGVIEIMSTVGTGYNGYLRIGTTVKAYATQVAGGTSQTQRVVFLPVVLTVAENNIINLAVYGNTADTIYAGNSSAPRTYLTVEAVG